MKRMRWDLLLLVVATTCAIVCACNMKSPDSEKAPQEKRDERFKKWVADTLQVLKNLQLYPNEKVKLDKDSLSLTIEEGISKRIDDKYSPTDESIGYALDLLDRNNLRPTDTFQLTLGIKYFYSASTVEQITYLFDSEITKFEVLSRDTVFDYSFVKGNLVDKRSRVR